MSGELVELTAAERALAEVETPEEAKDLYDKLEALSQYAKRYRVEHELQNRIAQTKLSVARKGGRMLAETIPPQSHDATTGTFEEGRLLPEGFTKSMSSRWQALAQIPNHEWTRLLVGAEELTMKAAVRLSREHELHQEREAHEAEARAAISDERPELVVADLRDWTPGPVDAIVTDPPYVGDVLPLYEALRDFAVRTLREGGALVVMTWQPILPGVLYALEHSELAYRWTICWRFAVVENTLDQPRRVFDCWKPVLVFHRGAMPADAQIFRDEIANSAGPDKVHHEWGQNLGGFERLVRSFTTAGELVCDPFLGGGTTALAALAHARRFIGCDVDAAAIETTQRRLAA